MNKLFLGTPSDDVKIIFPVKRDNFGAEAP
jgi:hypothetical protein